MAQADALCGRQVCPDMAWYLAQPHKHVMICDMAAAARCGNLPPGWMAFGLLVGDSEAARLAVGLHVVSSCLVQRRVAELGFDAHNWLDY